MYFAPSIVTVTVISANKDSEYSVCVEYVVIIMKSIVMHEIIIGTCT